MNVEDCELPLPQLRGSEPVTALDFSNKGARPAPLELLTLLLATFLRARRGLLTGSLLCAGLGVPSALVIASCLELNKSLTSFDASSNQIGAVGIKAIA